MLPKNALTSKITLISLAALALFFGNLKYQQIKQEKAIEKEKQVMVSQERELSQNNQELSNSLSYLTSDDFKERVARQQLNMQKEGEVVYNFSDAPTTSNSSTNTKIQSDSNAAKWWNYFFKDK